MLGGSLLLSACSSDSKDVYKERDVDTLYNIAGTYLDEGQYRYAAGAFDEVERQHPYSAWARRGQLMAAYSYYMANKYEDAILAAERFISLHPGNKDAPYAYYLVAICYYEQISDVGRDQKMTEQAMTALQEIVRRFPNTEFAQDARQKIDLTRDHLAGKEMSIGRYYLKSKEYLAASNRFRSVVDKYQTTTQVPEALHRLTESYLALGLIEEAQRSAAVLGENYPDSKWYKRSYTLLGKEHAIPARHKPAEAQPAAPAAAPSGNL
ncbi:outer membrane protein assembly factor BamD [Govanella unica]|uniref:Outer membrane protein assembly factor BamD n=1 Tax=Govanella unica TaxID=2975056 RepID=A0A9X3U0H8_9PROT|nr:outer membrane protein assembly factor BamD [Govania unica]